MNTIVGNKILVGCANQSGHVFAENPIGIPAMMSLMRDIWPGLEVRGRGETSIICGGATYRLATNNSDLIVAAAAVDGGEWEVRICMYDGVAERRLCKNGTITSRTAHCGRARSAMEMIRPS